MPQHLAVVPHLTEDELRARIEAAREPEERIRWMAILQKSLGKSAVIIADICNRKSDWVRRTVRVYNEHGPDANFDKRKQNGRTSYLTPDVSRRLVEALAKEAPPGGGLWTAPKAALWFRAELNLDIHPSVAWKYLRQVGWSPQVPRPKHPDSDEEAKDAFKKGGSQISSKRSSKNIRMHKWRYGVKTKHVSD